MGGDIDRGCRGGKDNKSTYWVGGTNAGGTRAEGGEVYRGGTAVVEKDTAG